ncbi:MULTISPECIES: hypothetical protein [unclassified Pseudoclavibacter]|uniref:hypothetical protein n=1 Tax=unclassified Pseudoclavibacter TaxID=2615177 RepID=UPI002016419E|nr:hypothetical protein [Pseudoclavibacter sp. Marseille-Q4354]
MNRAAALEPLPGNPYTPQSGDVSIRVEHYDLTLKYRMQNNRLSGTATLSIRATVPLTAFSLDLVGLRVSKVAARGDKQARFKQSDRKLKVTLSKPVEAGAAITLEVVYEGAPRPRRSRWGTIGWEELEDGIIVASQPTGAPTWFPCNDHPADKASYRIQVSVDSNYDVVATGALHSRRSSGGLTTWVYEEAHRPPATSSPCRSAATGAKTCSSRESPDACTTRPPSPVAWAQTSPTSPA